MWSAGREGAVTTVNLFNATPDSIVVFVNAGDPLLVPGTSATSNWVAQQPEEVVSWSNKENVKGQIGFKGCGIVVQHASASNAPVGPPSTFLIPPLGVDGPVTSIQIYIFSAGNGAYGLILLQDGFPKFSSKLPWTWF
jgi:hypothetical protein